MNLSQQACSGIFKSFMEFGRLFWTVILDMDPKINNSGIVSILEELFFQIAVILVSKNIRFEPKEES